MMETGASVRVVDAIPQEWGWDRENRQQESVLLQRYVGKTGNIWHIDDCREMPFIVSFSDSVKVPFHTMRFRGEELASL